MQHTACHLVGIVWEIDNDSYCCCCNFPVHPSYKNTHSHKILNNGTNRKIYFKLSLAKILSITNKELIACRIVLGETDAKSETPKPVIQDMK